MLTATDISVEFSGLRALDGVSLQLATGEILGLIGPNGSGKTTLVNAITGQVPLAAGAIRLDHAEITGLSPRRIALMGVMRSFQVVRLFAQLTVAENIETAALTHGLGRAAAQKQVARLLAEFDLSARADDLADALSYGEQRRVEIARALIAQPRYLLLDEPAAGLHETESDELLSLLARLPEERGLGLLIIDHDMQLITRLCHRLHVVASGRTIAEGGVDDVIAHPAVIAAYIGTAVADANA